MNECPDCGNILWVSDDYCVLCYWSSDDRPDAQHVSNQTDDSGYLDHLY